LTGVYGTYNFDTNPITNGGTVWEPGYYYFVTTVNKDDGHYNSTYFSSSVSGSSNQSSAVQDVILGNWISEFNPSDQTPCDNSSNGCQYEDEWALLQFLPYATSNILSTTPPATDDNLDASNTSPSSQGDHNQGKYVVPGQTIREVLTYQAADTLEQANRNEPADPSGHTHWPKYKDTDNQYKFVPINYCVTAYGPYQVPLDRPENRIDNLPNSGSPPIDGSGYINGNIPDSWKGTDGAKANRKQTICHTAQGGTTWETTENYDFITKVGNDYWEPGYYYFLTTVNKDVDYYNDINKGGDYFGAPVSNNTPSPNGDINSPDAWNNRNQVNNLSPSTYVNDFMIGSWISEFDPSQAAVTE
jgi:hypothetical protein